VNTVVIEGPMGPFLIPAEPQNTREHAEWISRGVWDGEYADPGLPRSGIRSALDVGAHCGSFAVLCQHHYGKDIRIDCYEPNPHACDLIKRNCPEANVHCVAVTLDPSPVYELPWDWGSAKTHGVKNAPAYGDRFSVPVIHPRDLPAADLVKCDAEGVEVEVLISYRHFTTLKVLIYEFHTLEYRDILRAFSRSNGFRCLREYDGEAIYGSSIWVRA
jgi:FkbM family methyltransferase